MEGLKPIIDAMTRFNKIFGLFVIIFLFSGQSALAVTVHFDLPKAGSKFTWTCRDKAGKQFTTEGTIKEVGEYNFKFVQKTIRGGKAGQEYEIVRGNWQFPSTAYLIREVKAKNLTEVLDALSLNFPPTNKGFEVGKTYKAKYQTSLEIEGAEKPKGDQELVVGPETTFTSATKGAGRKGHMIREKGNYAAGVPAKEVDLFYDLAEKEIIYFQMRRGPLTITCHKK